MADAPALTISLVDGSTRDLAKGASALDLAASIGRRLAKDAVAVEVDGEVRDLELPLTENATVRIITRDSDQGREILRHSTAHVLAQAVRRLWPGTQYAIGPAITDGFYYDFELPGGAHFTDDDLPRIESAMREIIAESQPFVREEHSSSASRAGTGVVRRTLRPKCPSAPRSFRSTATATTSSTCAVDLMCRRPIDWAFSH